MKRRILTLFIAVVFILTAVVLISGCKKGKAGETLSIIPENASLVANINFQKLAQLPIFDKSIKEAEEKNVEKPSKYFKDYKDFVEKTGIDPKKDITAMSIAVIGPMKEGMGQAPNFVAVAGLTYKKDKIINFIKSMGTEFKEEQYNGETIYKFIDEEQKEGAVVFLEGNIAMGFPNAVKNVIDTFKGKMKSVKENAMMKAPLEKMNPAAIFSFAMGIPEDAKKEHKVGGMMSIDMTKAECVFGNIDYADKTWTGLVQLVSKNETANQSLATTLEGFKGMMGAGGAEFAELAGKIKFTATAEAVKMEVSLSEALLEKIQQKLKSFGSQMAPSSEEMMPTAPEEGQPEESTEPSETTEKSE